MHGYSISGLNTVTAASFNGNANSATLYSNNNTTYTQWSIGGSKNGYGGILDNYSAVNIGMYDSAGNGGAYREANGYWYWYYLVSNACLGINGAGTSSSYSMQVNGGKGIYVVGGASSFGGDLTVNNASTVGRIYLDGVQSGHRQYLIQNAIDGISNSGLQIKDNTSNVSLLYFDTSYNATFSSNVNVAGTLTATVKSFVIPHPSKPGKTLQYGVLEGPEHSVYVRGKIQDTNIIELPDYWINLVDQDSITVNLTSIGKYQQLYVEEILGNQITIAGDENINAYYTVYGERKDVAKLVTEY
jgi:hypothetical protein